MANNSFFSKGFLISTEGIRTPITLETTKGSLTIKIIPEGTQIVFLPAGSMDTILIWFRHVDEVNKFGTLDLDNPETQTKATFELPLENLIKMEQIMRGKQIYYRKPTFDIIHPLSPSIFRIKIDGTNSTYIEKLAYFQKNYGDLISSSILDQLRQEADILIFLKEYPHPNIINLEELSTNGYSVSLILEDCKGGDLLYALNRKAIPINAPLIMFHILQAIQHLHSLNIVHRDIKLQNILLADETDWTSLKIADFGLSCHTSQIMQLNPRCGTPGYTAPEVFDCTRGYDEKVDVYSAGIVFFNILTMKNPFGTSKNPQDIMLRNISGEFDKTPLIPIINSQPNAYDLLMSMLDKNSQTRPSVKQCLNHQFFQKVRQDSLHKMEDNKFLIQSESIEHQAIKVQQPKLRQALTKKVKKC